MITPEKLKKIKEIVDKKYNTLTIAVFGPELFNKEELVYLKEHNLLSMEDLNYLDLVYNHTYLNQYDPKKSPISIPDMKAQQIKNPKDLPRSELHSKTMDSIETSIKTNIEKLKQDVMVKIEGSLKNSTLENTMQHIITPKTPEERKEFERKSIKQMAQELKGLSNNVAYQWERTVRTEMSNAVGIASVDAIVNMRKGKSLDEIYVYRLIMGAGTCKWCTSFYQDSDGTPKLYRLSELVSNGSNYGRHTSEWKPVALATHPNERCSRVIELARGFRFNDKGKVYLNPDFDGWDDYIKEKLKRS